MNDNLKNNWPFAESPNVAVYTVTSIWKENKPILYVYNEEDDGAWQFHTDKEPNKDEASIISLEEIINIDNSIMELSDLPYGWCAWRETKTSPWKRMKNI